MSEWEPLSVREARRVLAEWEAEWDGRSDPPQAVRDAWRRIERWDDAADFLMEATDGE